MSEHDSNIQFLGTKTENLKKAHEDRSFMTLLQPNKSGLLFSLQLPISSDLHDLNDICV